MFIQVIGTRPKRLVASSNRSRLRGWFSLYAACSASSSAASRVRSRSVMTGTVGPGTPWAQPSAESVAGSTLDVGELLADLAVPEAEHVDSPDVTRSAVITHPGVGPAQHPPVAADEGLLLGEGRLARLGEHLPPR